MPGTKLNVGQIDNISQVEPTDVIAVFPFAGRSLVDNADANILANNNQPEHIQISQLFNRFVTGGIIGDKFNLLDASTSIATADRFVIYQQSSGSLRTTTLSEITQGLGRSTYATRDDAGVVVLATQDQVNTGTDDNGVITSLTLRTTSDARYFTKVEAESTFYTQTSADATFLPIARPQAADIDWRRIFGFNTGTHVSAATDRAAGIVRFARGNEITSITTTGLVLDPAGLNSFLSSNQYLQNNIANGTFRRRDTPLSYTNDADITDKPDFLLRTDASSTYLTQANARTEYVTRATPMTETQVGFTRFGTGLELQDGAGALDNRLAVNLTHLRNWAGNNYLSLTSARANYLTTSTAASTYLPITAPANPDIPLSRTTGNLDASRIDNLPSGGGAPTSTSQVSFSLPQQNLTAAQWVNRLEANLNNWTTGPTSTTTGVAARSGTDIILREAGHYNITIDGSFNIPLINAPTSASRFFNDVEFRVYRDTDANQAGQVQEELLEDVSNYTLGYDTANFIANTGEKTKELTRSINDVYPAGTRLRIRRRILNQFYTQTGTAIGAGALNFNPDGYIGAFTIKIKKFNY